MSYILDPISLATDGFASPVEGGDYCLAPFALITHGIVVLEVDVADDKLADPSTGGRPPGWEPFDISYYRWKYGREQKRDQVDQPEPERPNVMPELLARDQTEVELRRLQQRNNETERDILELRAYIREVETGIESGLAAELAAQELELERQEAVMERLQDNIILAREALLVALEARRRHQNHLAAIEAVIRFYY